MPVAALFDVDGTLVTFTFDVQGARKALLKELSRRGLDTTGLSLSSPTQQIIDTAREQFQGRGPSGGFESLRQKLHSILDDFEEESIREATVFPETKETLSYLRDRSVRLAVLTNSGRKAAFAVLRKAEILDCFDFILTREDVETLKPSPAGILMAVERFAVPKKDVYYVGDGVLDIVAAKKAGLKVVSVATGITPSRRLREEGADFVISSLAELPGVLSV